MSYKCSQAGKRGKPQLASTDLNAGTHSLLAESHNEAAAAVLAEAPFFDCTQAVCMGSHACPHVYGV